MSHFQVKLEAGAGFIAPADQTVLASAEQAGLAWPTSCRSGTCRTCMCRLRGGQVAYRMAWPGLSPEEKAEGWILPCVAYPVSDLLLGEMAQVPWWAGDNGLPPSSQSPP